MIDVPLPPSPTACRPPAARGRDGIRLLFGGGHGISHHAFGDLPDLLAPGDLLVVNTSATPPAAVRLDRLWVHFSTPCEQDRGTWLVELRRRSGRATVPYRGGNAGEWIPMPGGATLTLVRRRAGRLWEARLSADVVPYLRRYGVPIRYGYAGGHRTVIALDPSADLPGAGRPFTPDLVTRLVARGVLMSPVSLHTGVVSLEAREPPYAERYEVPGSTADLVNHVRERGRRVVAVGATAVRALETAATASGEVVASSGWTEHVVTPQNGVQAVDGLLTGLHRPESPHLPMLAAIAGPRLLEETYAAALSEGYLWHEFGDVTLLMP
ncbi:MAG TPA: S-adenosylmethionine:tRNA ribosyltransferase-isomerase [Thermomonospora sp.]|nr:S-adenosylmethionine:tRNA ribosyltransferase-isomerase [Thermomonospora sp.]